MPRGRRSCRNARGLPCAGRLRAPHTAGPPSETATKDERLIRDRQEQLILAAIKVFEEKGFHLTTVRDIGRAARLTQGTIYNYVRSKEDIPFLVCDRFVTEYQDTVRHALSGNGSVTARLAGALRGIVQVLIERQSTILLLYHESHNLDRRSLRVILARVGEFIENFDQLLREAHRQQRLRASNFELVGEHHHLLAHDCRPAPLGPAAAYFSRSACRLTCEFHAARAWASHLAQGGEIERDLTLVRLFLNINIKNPRS